METMQHLRSGSTSSKPTWAYKTPSTQICCQEQKGQQQYNRCRASSRSRNAWGSRALDTVSQQPQVHPNQHNISCSSQGADNTSSNGPLSIQAALPTLLNPPGNIEHWLPHKVAQANLQPQQLWGVVLNTGAISETSTHNYKTRSR